MIKFARNAQKDAKQRCGSRDRVDKWQAFAGCYKLGVQIQAVVHCANRGRLQTLARSRGSRIPSPIWISLTL